VGKHSSGAHLNPAVTLTFFRLGKVRAVGCGVLHHRQFAGGVAGVVARCGRCGTITRHPSVNYVATLPGTVDQARHFWAKLPSPSF